MGSLRVGAGGWAYFQIPGKDSLTAYSSAFDFVEVNSTFYEYPSLNSVAGWRKRVPTGFEFAVRCHRDLVERFRLRPGPGMRQVMGTMEKVCKTLQANVLAILVPEKAGLREGELVSGLDEALSTFHVKGTRVAVEVRGRRPTAKVLRVMAENDAVHCVDLSREEPGYGSGVLYSRLFGKGEGNVYEFDDEELKEIGARASKPKFERSILAFHGVRMYRDAARLKMYVNSGSFAQITGQTGLDSLMQVLKEDAVFPITGPELVRRQGWKLFDLTKDKRVRASVLLERLPEARYGSLEDLRGALEEHVKF